MKYGFAFLLVALAIAISAVRHGPWSWLLFYPAFSFGVVSAAYFFEAPAVFGKRFDGRRSKLGTLLVFPYVLYVQFMWHVLKTFSHEPAMNELGNEYVLSRRLLRDELPDHIASVVDLTCEFTEPNHCWTAQSYLSFPMLDGSGPPSNEIQALAKEILKMPTPTLIHCAQGHGRTGLVAAAVLLVSGKAQTASDAVSMIQTVRPGVSLNAKQRSILEGI